MKINIKFAEYVNNLGSTTFYYLIFMEIAWINVSS